MSEPKTRTLGARTQGWFPGVLRGRSEKVGVRGLCHVRRSIPPIRLRERPGATITVDLETQTVTAPDGATHGFDIDPFRKRMLLIGQDEIALTLGYEAMISVFEERQRAETPWVIPKS